MISLCERLSLIAGLVKSGERVADIGTDHAYLPIFLRQTGKSPYVLACDINMSPLNSAMKNVKDCRVSGIDFRLCDGLLGISQDEVDTIVIAGMGGECIAGILERCSWIKNSEKKLLLQPMNSPEELRKILKNDFTLLSEQAVFDNGRIYTVMEVLCRSDDENTSQDFVFTGLLNAERDADKAFLEKQYNRLSSCAKSLENIEEKQEEREYYLSACQAIKRRIEKE